MTTIITKNGTGVPANSSLATGELAVDTTNKRIYTSSDGTNVFEVGTNPSTLTVDTDTLYVNAANNRVGINTSSPSYTLAVRASSETNLAEFRNIDGGDNHGLIVLDGSGTVDIKATYSTNAPDLAFYTGNSERMRIKSSGNVGIGTANPSNKLVVSNGGAEGLEVYTNDATFGTGLIAYNRSGATWLPMTFRAGIDGYKWYSSGGVNTMSLTNTGNVGIGETDPSNPLHISSNAAVTTRLSNPDATGNGDVGVGILAAKVGTGRHALDIDAYSMTFATGSSGATSVTIASSGNVGIGTSVPASLFSLGGSTALGGDTSSAITFLNSVSGVVTDEAAAEIACVAGSSRREYELSFKTGSLGSTTERMRIDTSGNLLVGKTNTGSVNFGLLVKPGAGETIITGSTGTIPLVIRRESGQTNLVDFEVGGVQSGYITVASGGGTPAFAAPSDERLKDNITDHESELANVMALRPVRWDWKDEAKGSGEGFIAQELEQTAWSDLVTEGGDGYKQVAGLGTVETRLIKAIQEQQAMIEELKAEVAALKGA